MALPVRIDSMAFRGYGVARVSGKVLFVPHAIKGEEVEAELVDEKKDYSLGTVKRVIQSSPWRVTPPCPYFGRCGGCQWQHIDYTAQVTFKREILEETLKRLSAIHDVPKIALFPSPQPYGYRIRVQLKTEGDKIGYFRERSHHVIDVDHCPIAHPLINQIIPMLHRLPGIFSHIPEIEINVSPEEGRGILILHARRLPSGIERALADLLRENPLLKGMTLVRNDTSDPLGEPVLHFTVSLQRDGRDQSLRFRTSPGGFFQIHREQNHRLIQTVLQFGEARGNQRVLDLYSGVGNFSLPLALDALEVIGIEENRAAVKDARTNAHSNGIERCRFIRGKVEEVLKSLNVQKPSLIVLDPPRAGCRQAVAGIVRLNPARVVYVSCEPTTFSRDLRLFLNNGYVLAKLALVDLFPQSYHMETVALLTPATSK